MQLSADALINAENLRNNNVQKRNLKEVITDIVRGINSELIVAHREGKHHIITNIPITFNIPNMTNKNSQRYIWASIIEEIKNKGYRVWINPTSDNCKLKITWLNSTDESEINLQNDLITKHLEKF